MKATSELPMPEIFDAHERAAHYRSEKLSEAEIMSRIKMLAELLDNRFTIPGTNYRFGLDALAGLIPGVGDFATAALSGYVVYLAHQLDVPRHLLARMVVNIAIDASVGTIPVLGDFFDVAWKANIKNMRLLERHLQSRKR